MSENHCTRRPKFRPSESVALLVKMPADRWREHSGGSCHQYGFVLRRTLSPPWRPDNVVGTASNCQLEGDFGTWRHHCWTHPDFREAIPEHTIPGDSRKRYCAN